MGSAMYLRKSRADEPNEDVKTTLRKHKVQLEEFAQRNRIPIVKVYEEVVTGDSLFIRPQMIQLLSDVEAGLYQSVVCMDIDRLGRGDMKDQGIILETFKFSGTKIATPEKTYDLDNDLDEELTEFKTFMSRRELKTITKRLQRGLRQTIMEGGYIANAPYGYEKTVIDRKPSLKIKEDEAYFIRMIFDMYVNQDIGCYTIAETINSLGARPRRSAAFGRGTVEHIIKNPVYIGKIVWDRSKHIKKGKRGNDKGLVILQPQEKWITANGIHPPIISEELFNRAQEILGGRYHPPSNDGTVKNPLAGVVKCAQCGSTMQVHKTRGKWSYLKCLNKQCSCASSNLDYVEESVIDHFEKLLTKLELDTLRSAPVDTTELENALKNTQRTLSLAVAQKDSLFDLLEQKVYTVETFTHRSIAIDEKISSLTELEAQQKQQLEDAKIDRRQERIEKVKTVLKLYSSLDARGKNRLLKETVLKIEYNKASGSPPQEFDIVLVLK